MGKPLSVADIKTSFIDIPKRICVTIYLCGCNIKCSGCHNETLWEYKPESVKEVVEIVKIINKQSELIDSVCIMGGEPLMQDNNELLKLILEIRSIPLEVCLYTSYELDQIPGVILDNLDMVKTGKYRKELESDGNLASSNQKFFIKEKGEWIQW